MNSSDSPVLVPLGDKLGVIPLVGAHNDRIVGSLQPNSFLLLGEGRGNRFVRVGVQSGRGRVLLIVEHILK